MTRARLFLTALLAGAIVILVLWSTHSPSPDGGSDRGPVVVDGSSVTRSAAESPAPGHSSDRTLAAREDLGRPDSPEGSPVEPARPWLLEVELSARGLNTQGTARVRLDGRGPEDQPRAQESNVQFDLTGRTTIDISSFVGRLDAGIDQWVTVTLRGGSGLFAEGGFRIARWDSTAADEVERVYRVLLDTRRVGVLTGTVLALDARAAVNCRIGLFGAEETSEAPPSLTSARTDARGRFRLQHEAAGSRGYLVAFAEGCRPLTLPLAALVGGSLELGELQLEEGAVLSGTLDIGSVEPNLYLAALRRDSGTNLLGASLTWSEGRFEIKNLVLRTGPDREFHAAGLVPGWAYRLTLLGGEATCSMMASPGRDAESHTAPDANLTLGFAVPRVVCRVHSDRGPVVGAEVRFYARANLELLCHTQADGELEVFSRVNESMSVEVEASGHRLRRIAIQLPGLGETLLLPFRLERLEQTGSLNVDVQGAQESGIRAVLLEAYPAEAGCASEMRSWTRRLELRDGSAMAQELPVGDFLLLARPEVETDTRLAPIESRVRVDGEKVASLDLAFPAGGTLTLRVLDREGRLSDSRCRVLRSDGTEVCVAFVSADPVTGMWVTDVERPHPLGGQASVRATLASPLASGDYELEVRSETGHEVRESFQVVDGQVTDLEVRLP